MRSIVDHKWPHSSQTHALLLAMKPTCSTRFWWVTSFPVAWYFHSIVGSFCWLLPASLPVCLFTSMTYTVQADNRDETAQKNNESLMSFNSHYQFEPSELLNYFFEVFNLRPFNINGIQTPTTLMPVIRDTCSTPRPRPSSRCEITALAGSRCNIRQPVGWCGISCDIQPALQWSPLYKSSCKKQIEELLQST